MSQAERVLFVAAHPDDESIDTGGTIALLTQRGASVTVLTCTRGERGEVIPADLQGALESGERLAALRGSELDAALTALGVADHRYLGDADARWRGQPARRYLDSGMQWGADGAEATAQVDPASLTGAEFADVAADIAAVIEAVGPDVVVSYNQRGGYGHPDHVRAGEAALRAAQVYDVPYYAIDVHGELEIDVRPVIERKRAALAAYRSQLTLDGEFMVYPGGQRLPVATKERYSPVPEHGPAPLPYSEQHPASRVTAALFGCIIGIALGALLTVYHQVTGQIGDRPIWTGAIAAVLIAALVLTGLRLAFGTVVVPAAAAIGLIIVVAVLSFASPGGPLLIPQNGRGILWEVAPVVLGMVVVAWPRTRRRGPGKIGTQPPKGT